MYTTGQEVTVIGKFGVREIKKVIYERSGEGLSMYQLNSGEVVMDNQIRPYKPRKAAIHQSTYPRNFMVSNRRV